MVRRKGPNMLIIGCDNHSGSYKLIAVWIPKLGNVQKQSRRIFDLVGPGSAYGECCRESSYCWYLRFRARVVGVQVKPFEKEEVYAQRRTGEKRRLAET